MKKVLEDINIFEMGGLLYLYYGKVDYKTFRRISRRMNRINRKQKETRKEN